MSTPSNSSYTVVRIKRKATETPLSSLVINNERATKRRDLGSGRRAGVFKLAETVPHTWVGDGAEGETLKSRIEGLLRSGEPTPLDSPATELPPPTAPPSAPAATSPLSTLSPPPGPYEPHVPRSRYRVVPRAPAHDINFPPRVITNAEIAAAKAALVLIDAQAVGPDGTSPEEEDPEMAAFLPMLKEYLKMESGVSQPPTPREDDDYVYDLYYHDDRAQADTEGTNVGALLGYEDLSPPSTPPDSEPEDEADEDSNDEDYYRNDYPEDEDADEDMEGFHDAYSDGEWSNDSAESERGVWDYRE